MPLPQPRKVLADRARHEQNHHHSRRDPERPVQVRVAVQHVEKVGAREQRSPASLEDFSRVDVEELAVEGERPEKVLVGRGRAR